MAGMTIERLEHLIRERGADLSAWPEDDRLEAEALMRESRDVKNLFEEMKVIALAQSVAQAPEASEALKTKILADASEMLSQAPATSVVSSNSEERNSRSFVEAVWVSLTDMLSPWATQVAAMLAVALVGGVLAGAWVSSPSIDQETLVAAYGADVDYWMSELDPNGLQINGGET